MLSLLKRFNCCSFGYFRAIVGAIGLSACNYTPPLASAIQTTQQTRIDQHLIPLDNRWQLDSTTVLKAGKYDALFTNQLHTPNPITDTLNNIIYYTKRCYTLPSPGLRMVKELYLYHNSDGVRISAEVDRYAKPASDSMEFELWHFYSYATKASFSFIDSLPNAALKKRRLQRLSSITKSAEQRGGDICGTSAREILTNGLPRARTHLSHTQAKAYLLAMNAGEQ